MQTVTHYTVDQMVCFLRVVAVTIETKLYFPPAVAAPNCFGENVFVSAFQGTLL